ncbi:MAG: rRNA pseudouridine synthase [Sphaerochaetaceae bacterium]|nr:rRNA pseudouridine synthase [Sphaerochaetaceae bacterium]
MERLDKVISGSGRLSRKECRSYVKQKRITVDGEIATSVDMKVDKDRSEIKIDGDLVLTRRRMVAILNKPSGYVTSTEDPRDKTVMALIPEEYRYLELFPVGRLDKETEGLLVMTNDGELAHRLIAPKNGVRKVYFARFEGNLVPEDVDAFREGLTLKDGQVCLPAEICSYNDGCLILIREGKYHQVRRMMASRGMKVTYLERVMEGDLSLANLERGGFRVLTAEEEKLLFSEEKPYV